MKIKKWHNVAGAALLLPLLFACSSSNDSPDDNGKDFDPKAHPVEFSTSIRDFSSSGSGATTQFSDGDKVTVQTIAKASGTSADWSKAHTGTYTATSGKLTCQAPVYWQSETEERYVRAWHDGSANPSFTLPTSWTVPADQSQSSAAATDFLYASGTVSYGASPKIEFTHQLCQVILRVKLISPANPQSGEVEQVNFGGGVMGLKGEWTAPEEGKSYGTWAVSAPGSVKPREMTAAAGYGYMAAATVIPQDMTNKKLFSVTMGDGRQTDWEADSQGLLEAGASYIFDMSIDCSLGTVSVTRVTGATWAEGENLDINSGEKGPDYGELKIGDYYYSDGSWSDGGFQGYDTSGHGSVKWADPKPAPTKLNPVTGQIRTLIGIVYTTDLDRMGATEKSELEAKGIKPHGLALCVKTLRNTQWSNIANDESTIGIPNIRGAKGDPLYNYVNAAISGLSVMRAIQKNRATEIEKNNYLAVKDVSNIVAPDKSTGWFIPATGQWIDMLRNFTGMDFTDKSEFYFPSNEIEPEDGLHFDWQIDMTLKLQAEYKENFVEILNIPLSNIPEEDRDLFLVNDNFITATLADANNLYYTNVLPKFITVRRASKSYWLNVRPMIAF